MGDFSGSPEKQEKSKLLTIFRWNSPLLRFTVQGVLDNWKGVLETWESVLETWESVPVFWESESENSQSELETLWNRRNRCWEKLAWAAIVEATLRCDKILGNLALQLERMIHILLWEVPSIHLSFLDAEPVFRHCYSSRDLDKAWLFGTEGILSEALCHSQFLFLVLSTWLPFLAGLTRPTPCCDTRHRDFILHTVARIVSLPRRIRAGAGWCPGCWAASRCSGHHVPQPVPGFSMQSRVLGIEGGSGGPSCPLASNMGRWVCPCVCLTDPIQVLVERNVLCPQLHQDDQLALQHVFHGFPEGRDGECRVYLFEFWASRQCWAHSHCRFGKLFLEKPSHWRHCCLANGEGFSKTRRWVVQRRGIPCHCLFGVLVCLLVASYVRVAWDPANGDSASHVLFVNLWCCAGIMLMMCRAEPGALVPDIVMATWLSM